MHGKRAVPSDISEENASGGWTFAVGVIDSMALSADLPDDTTAFSWNGLTVALIVFLSSVIWVSESLIPQRFLACSFNSLFFL